MGSTKQSTEETHTLPNTSPVSSELDGYDSDCLVIIEGDHPPIEVTEASSNIEATEPSNDLPISSPLNNDPKRKSHNLPIHELKKKLAYCPVCKVQYTSHKAANLCLSKHGKRQCWLCLDVMANSKDSYFQHCVHYHAVGPSSDIVGCPYCQKFFDFRQGFNQHIVKVHFSEDTSFVSSTASLSPTSLVDLYTGQPRRGRRLNDYGNEIKNSETSSTSESLEEISLNPHLDGVGGIVQLRNRRTRIAVTRESVIRETPPSNLTNSKVPGAPPSVYPPVAFPNFRQFLSNHSAINAGIDDMHQMQLNRPQSQPQPQVTSTSTASSGNPTCGKKGSAFIRINSDYNPPQRSKSNPLHCSSTNLSNRIENITPDSGSSSSSPAGSCFTDAQLTKSDSASPLASVSVSPSLLEMQRMVQSSQVQMQYFNSVKSMLRTVAECGPNNSLINSEALQGEGNDANGSLGSTCRSHSIPLEQNERDSHASTTPSDLEVFKVPNNVGVKRRILTKWDEHQERQVDDSQIVSTKFHSQPFQEKIHNMSMSLNGRTRPQSRNSMAPEDRHFWEQVIRESNAVYKGSNNQNQLDYPDDTHQLTQSQYQDLQVQSSSDEMGSSFTTISQSNYSERTHLYPRIMARVDSTGRPIGMFTANGQPCVLSSNPSMNNPYANQNPNDHMYEQSQYSHSQKAQTHRQYQYKIIPQATTTTDTSPINDQQSQGRCSTNTSGEFISSRKRKASVPIRVVANPHYDSVVIQNPFEEESIPLTSSKRPNLAQSPSQNHGPVHPYRPGGHLLEAARDQALAQWEALVRQQQYQYHQLQQNFITTGGRLHHCQPKFTAGGQITEFPLQGSRSHMPTRAEGCGGGRPNNSQNQSVSILSGTVPSAVLNSKESSQAVPSTNLIEGQYKHDEAHQLNLIESQLQPPNNNNGLCWPPFVVAPRYQEHCHTILTRLKDLELERQRRMGLGIQFRDSDI